MIVAAAPHLSSAIVLDVGSGLGVYVRHLTPLAKSVFGIEYEQERAKEALRKSGSGVFVRGAAERLPYPQASFDVVLCNEVIEHVQDDRRAVAEMIRVLKVGGRLVLFCPNRWYPVEQHGVYLGRRYIFGNIPLVNYLPDFWRSRLAPHVRTYTRRSLLALLEGTPSQVVSHRVIFGGYDNLAARFGVAGRAVKAALHAAESTPLSSLGLSHLLVVEKVG